MEFTLFHAGLRMSVDAPLHYYFIVSTGWWNYAHYIGITHLVTAATLGQR
jgi:hypothetical protein